MFEVTDKAVGEIKRIRANEPDAEKAVLRVMITGGGCSGMSYKLGFDKDQNKDDKTFEKGGVVIVIDPKSLLFLKGTILDFTDGLTGRGFVFNNPNAKRTCGCGDSFSA